MNETLSDQIMKTVSAILTFSIILLLCETTSAQLFSGLFGPTTPVPRKDREFQTRRYRCEYDSGIQKKCICIIKVVKKKLGNLFKNLGCEIFNPVDDLMVRYGPFSSLCVSNFCYLNTQTLDGSKCRL